MKLRLMVELLLHQEVIVLEGTITTIEPMTTWIILLQLGTTETTVVTKRVTVTTAMMLGWHPRQKRVIMAVQLRRTVISTIDYNNKAAKIILRQDNIIDHHMVVATKKKKMIVDRHLCVTRRRRILCMVVECIMLPPTLAMGV